MEGGEEGMEGVKRDGGVKRGWRVCVKRGWGCEEGMEGGEEGMEGGEEGMEGVKREWRV